MSLNAWKTLLAAPAVLGAVFVASNAAIAVETQELTETAEVSSELLEIAEIADVESVAQPEVSIEEIIASETSLEVADVPAESTDWNQLMQYSSEGNSSLDQVTSINQLSDVRPTDWAFQALQSLVERYGCIAGYPDGTYRGNNFMTRYEFAAGLNACLDRINELIGGVGGGVTREDLAAIQRLQEEFAAELATLRGRVDSLEARTAELEANQFSTTTKLNGAVVFNLAAEFADVFDDQATFGYRVRQNFDSSFSGDDRLRVRLQARDLSNFVANNQLGAGFSYSGGSSDNVELDNLFYDFPLGSNIDVRIGANSLGVDDFVASTISPLDSSTSGSLSGFGFPQQYNMFVTGNAGAGAIIQLTDSLSLDFGYTADDAENPFPGQGLFNGAYSAIGQLTYLGGSIDAALTYIHTYSGGTDFDDVTFDQYVGNTFGGQINFRVTDGVEIGGGVAYTNVRDLDSAGLFNDGGDADLWSWQGTLAFPDLGGEGNMLGILAGVLPYTRDLGVPELGLNETLSGDTSFLAEVFYLYRLNDNISLTPGLIWLSDPYNNNDTEDAFIGALRTVFSF